MALPATRAADRRMIAPRQSGRPGGGICRLIGTRSHPLGSFLSAGSAHLPAGCQNQYRECKAVRLRAVAVPARSMTVAVLIRGVLSKGRRSEGRRSKVRIWTFRPSAFRPSIVQGDPKRVHRFKSGVSGGV